jgi:hypothetical protein
VGVNSPLAMLALAIALVIRTVKQYTRSLLGSAVGDSSVGDSVQLVDRTSAIVEVRAAGFFFLWLWEWESGGIPSCGNCNVLLTLLLLLLLQ